jgi:hypothetical protein
MFCNGHYGSLQVPEDRPVALRGYIAGGAVCGPDCNNLVMSTTLT